MLRRGLYLGFLTAALDYNRVGWTNPEDSIIIRVTTKPVDAHFLQAIAKRPDERVSYQELENMKDQHPSTVPMQPEPDVTMLAKGSSPTEALRSLWHTLSNIIRHKENPCSS